MKNILFLLSFFLISGCSPKLYTHPSYFNCGASDDFNLQTERQKNIYHLLERALVTEKDIPDYVLHKNKKQFYILNKEFIKLDKAPHWDYKPLLHSEQLTNIGEVQFCWKSKEELQEIADSTDDFLFLSIRDIKIDNDKASVGLDNAWLVAEKNKFKYTHMSGGGYRLPLIKVDGKWIIDSNKKWLTWQS